MIVSAGVSAQRVYTICLIFLNHFSLSSLCYLLHCRPFCEYCSYICVCRMYACFWLGKAHYVKEGFLSSFYSIKKFLLCTFPSMCSTIRCGESLRLSQHSYILIMTWLDCKQKILQRTWFTVLKGKEGTQEERENWMIPISLVFVL